jgi:eukaryotic-like serine/threonine-protein kinase
MEPVAAPRTFSGRYEVTHLIARGGMAQVYRALDLRLGRYVALKVLFPELSIDPTFVERFRREAQAAANLSHPNVVAVYDWGEDEGTYFIVMELITGTSLATALRTEHTLPATRAADIAAGVASALSYAHRHGVVHRDIKPGNVMLTDDGQIKVTDFGIAQAVSTEGGLTMAGSVMGTAAYFSPEQAEGAVVDGRSDVYSLGVVLYEMLTGRTPYVGDSPVAVASMHVRNTPPLLRDLNPAVPPAIEAVTLHALQKAPERRYQSAEEFRDDLLRFREGRPVLAGAVGADDDFIGVPATSVVAAGAGTTSVLQAPDATSVVPSVTGTTAAPVVGVAAVVPPLPPQDPPVPRGDRAPRGGADDQSTSTRTGWIAAGLVIALLVIGFFAWHALAGPSTITVPYLTGTPVATAEGQIGSAGLTVQGTQEVNSGQGAGDVVRTVPPAGTAVKPGSKILIYVSKGQVVDVLVPPVVGNEVATAEASLSSQGLNNVKLNPVPTWPMPVAPGTVLGQNPAPGTTIPTTTLVTLTTLAPNGTYPVPNVVGEDQSTAGATLAGDGLHVASTQGSACSNAAIAQGNVASTDPTQGTKVVAGTTVTLTISTGACPVNVPNLLGLTPAQASAQISAAGLDPSVDPQCGPGNTSTGFIASQDPQALQPVAPGTTVYAFVGCVASSTSTTTTTIPGAIQHRPSGYGAWVAALAVDVREEHRTLR